MFLQMAERTDCKTRSKTANRYQSSAWAQAVVCTLQRGQLAVKAGVLFELVKAHTDQSLPVFGQGDLILYIQAKNIWLGMRCLIHLAK